jgi:fucose permease
VIVGGYVLAVATTLAFALAPPTPSWLLFLFVCSGVYIACEEVAEKSYAAPLVLEDRRGAGMGLLAATNGIGDMVSSALVGSLWSLLPNPAWGFGAAATLQVLGAFMIAVMGPGLARPARPPA